MIDMEKMLSEFESWSHFLSCGGDPTIATTWWFE